MRAEGLENISGCVVWVLAKQGIRGQSSNHYAGAIGRRRYRAHKASYGPRSTRTPRLVAVVDPW